MTPCAEHQQERALRSLVLWYAHGWLSVQTAWQSPVVHGNARRSLTRARPAQPRCFDAGHRHAPRGRSPAAHLHQPPAQWHWQHAHAISACSSRWPLGLPYRWVSICWVRPRTHLVRESCTQHADAP